VHDGLCQEWQLNSSGPEEEDRRNRVHGKEGLIGLPRGSGGRGLVKGLGKHHRLCSWRRGRSVIRMQSSCESGAGPETRKRDRPIVWSVEAFVSDCTDETVSLWRRCL